VSGATPSPFTSAARGEAPEVAVSKDMVKRGVIVTPIFLILGGVIWGLDGVSSVAFAIGLVLLNFSLASALVAMTAPISLGLMMGAVLFGYLIRLGLIAVAILLVKDASWINLSALGITIIVTHLGLLFWEMKYVAASLAFPGLKPNAQE
jgi:hypothetical protein